MSIRTNNKRTSQKFNVPVTDSSIETLQDRLLKSLSTAFDPNAVAKSDDLFLSQDYSLGNNSEILTGAFKDVKNPYKTITDKAKNYVEKAQAERSVRAKTAIPSGPPSKKSDTFLTNVELEGNRRKRVEPAPVEQEEEEDPLPSVTYDGMFGEVRSEEDKDDLEELRRMIRNTKKEMVDYGKELLCLRNDVLDMNDLGSKIGFGVSEELLRNIENTVNSLQQKNAYAVERNETAKEIKNPGMLQTIPEEPVKRVSRSFNMSATNPAGPATFIVTKKNYGVGARPSSYRGGGGLRK